MATKLLASLNRNFKNIFVCKQCKHRMRLTSLKVLSGKVSCRKCGYKHFRPVRRK